MNGPSCHGGRDSPIPACAGVGLRYPHHAEFLQRRPATGWLEVHSENYFSAVTQRTLVALRPDYPLSLHGVGLSLGSADPLDDAHLRRLRQLCQAVEPAFVSEHLSWSQLDGRYWPDLLPLPLTEEALTLVVTRVQQVQEGLGRRLLLENPSSYLRWRHSCIPEPEFLAAVAQRTGCGLLCDLNNVYVSAWNHGGCALDYLDALPAAAVAEYHLAGHCRQTLPGGRDILIDHHGARVDAAVWALFARALECIGPRPTLIEWDTDIPAVPVLLAEAAEAERLLQEQRRARPLAA